MSSVLGLDTSNYTTSAALYESATGKITHYKKLLPVKFGQMGLRQSDAVFHHVQQLPEVMDKLFADCKETPCAVGASLRPRDLSDSYMPCFTVGSSNAAVLGSVLHVPVYYFSHQSGHIAAALHSAGRLDLLQKKFLAFHVSGGTTEAVIVSPDNKNVLSVKLVAETLDLNAGQAIDRVGGLLGLRFPAGMELERLALTYDGNIKCKPVLKGSNCCLSGVENICEKMLRDGEPSNKIARFCIEYIAAALDGMCEQLLQQYGPLPVLFAGGVMSNSIINQRFTHKYQALFAAPEFSSDNAAGVAILTAIKAEHV